MFYSNNFNHELNPIIKKQKEEVNAIPRVARKNHISQYFHIVVKGINAEYIFRKKEYMEKYKNLLKKNAKNHQINILAYCIMNNHAHILLYTKEKTEMASFMQKTNTSYAKYYNFYEDREGYVFKGRYYTQNILSLKQLYNCLVYIHKNPIKANLVTKMEDYPFSSYHEFFKDKEIIDEQSIKLLELKLDNYYNDLIKIHRMEDITDIFDIKEYIDAQQILREYENNYKQPIKKLKEQNEILEKIIVDLNEKAGMPIRKIAEKISVNKNKVNKILKEKRK